MPTHVAPGGAELSNVVPPPAPADSGADGAFFTVVSEIVDALIEAYKSQRPINLSRLKAVVSAKHRASSMPRVRGRRAARAVLRPHAHPVLRAAD